jgi:Na+-driven multidrug efflux pump
MAFIISTLIAVYWYARDREMYVNLEWRNITRFMPKLQKEILGVGLPESVELSVMNIFNIFLNMFVIACAGTAGLAVYTMVWRIGYIAIIPAQAVGGALIAVCSAEYGMKEFGMIRDAYYFSIRRSFVMVLLFCAVFALLAGVLADVFIRTEDMEFMHDEMVLFSYTMAGFLPVFAMTFVGSSLMQSLQKAGHAMVNTLLRNVFITVAYWIVTMVAPGLLGIGVALIIVEGLGGIAMLIHGKIILDMVERHETAAVPT